MTRGALVLPIGLLWCGPAAADCVEVASTARFTLTVEDAEAAFASLDLEGFEQATDSAAVMVPCLDALVSRPLAARYHRLQGLRGWLKRDADRSRSAFLAARRIEPAFRFPAELVPGDHPVQDEYSALPLDELSEEAVDIPTQVALVVDGRASNQRPVDVPAVIQATEQGGALLWSTYAWPGDALPPWPELDAAGPSPTRTPLLIAFGASSVAAVSFWALAASAEARHGDSSTPADQLDGLRTRTNAFVIVASGFTAAAGGTGAAFAWTFR